MSTRIADAYLDCGHHAAPDGFASGYATASTGKTLCYECADAWAVTQLLRDREAFGYLSADHSYVTTWTGGRMARVTSYTESRSARRCYVRAVDVHGQRWHGTGPLESGTFVRLRKSKGGTA